jgi:hypothetical protein
MLFGISFNRFVHLVGWLPIYLSGYLHGYLHRDISNGNILMSGQTCEEEKVQDTPRSSENHLSLLQDRKAVEAIKELCMQVKDLTDMMLGISDQCTASVTDGDTLGDYSWTQEHRATKSVSYFCVIRKAVLHAAHRVHL